MRGLRGEQGIALVASILILMVMAGLGLGLLLITNNQQKASAREQASESAFNVAEAALNAQVGQLSRAWPAKEVEAYPDSVTPPKIVRCTAATSTSKNGCPDASLLAAGYPNISPVPCAASATSDAWGSALTNQWTTYVRDDAGEPPSALFNSASEAGQPGWDKNGNDKVWLRSVGAVQCHMVVVITLVSRQLVALNFPRNSITANWFETTNNGNHSGPIVDTGRESSQPGEVSMRCTAPHPEPCANYQPGQVEPYVPAGEASPPTTLSQTQLEALKQQAKAAGAYYPTGTCPSGIPAGLPAYVEGPCEVKETGNDTINSKASPGFLVIENGTFELAGGSKFYGVVYAANKQGSSGAIVRIQGNAELIGAIDVDGNGGIEFGSSGTNFVYDSTALNEIKTYAGAAATRNSFRILSSSE
jgi:Tfp pilus assembly protein PilX